MTKKLVLDEFEQEIEDNFETYKPVKNMEQEIAMLVAAAKTYNKTKNPSHYVFMRVI